MSVVLFCGMEAQRAFETVCEHLGIKVRYL